VRVHVFGQVTDGASPGGGHDALFVGGCRDQDDLGAGQFPADSLGSRRAVAWHLDVEQAHVGPFSQRCRDGFGTGARLGADLDSASLEILPEGVPELRVIVCDQNPH